MQEEVREVDAASLENLPTGLDEMQYRWVDLDGEGLSGILTEQSGAWFYKRNLSPINTREENGETTIVASFGPLEKVDLTPSLAAISSGGQQLLDLAGDGQLDLVQLDGPTLASMNEQRMSVGNHSEVQCTAKLDGAIQTSSSLTYRRWPRGHHGLRAPALTWIPAGENVSDPVKKFARPSMGKGPRLVLPTAPINLSR